MFTHVVEVLKDMHRLEDNTEEVVKGDFQRLLPLFAEIEGKCLALLWIPEVW